MYGLDLAANLMLRVGAISSFSLLQPLYKPLAKRMINRLIAALYIGLVAVTSAFFLSWH
jgi:hypothetical protein